MTYGQLTQWRRRKGIVAYMQGPDQLVMSNTNPATPSSNCLWATVRDGEWYIGTWLLLAYHVPQSEDVGNVCASVFRSSNTAIYTIDPDLANRHNLKRLSDDEMEKLGFA